MRIVASRRPKSVALATLTLSKVYADTPAATVPAENPAPAFEGTGAGRMGRGMGPSLRRTAVNLSQSTIERNRAGMVKRSRSSRRAPARSGSI
jgi:hypothetical protein